MASSYIKLMDLQIISNQNLGLNSFYFICFLLTGNNFCNPVWCDNGLFYSNSNLIGAIQ